ncbi:alkylhydroperoxidase AhpD family core domain-containing protein [Kibdelosporangium aridum]|uniref:Alkylhydroperoxidase AhpD family core domain-containing protein n=2 Tax=Kibdelosporangium aridum TaxID=2030 RepID=A0A1W2ARI3_KIBAR|nr:carboxymuconolactone decarboxylase family protein [Kibdelosporangium aridum]SMC63327.1 alkylhydroperoxidase AhpD family core domain-containing protein [Kibdelosporangium aridum]
MQPRLKPPMGAYKHMAALEEWQRESPLPERIRELVKLRVSQINGCAFCVDMHAHDMKAAGETDERLFSVVTWEETPFFTEQERAALRLAEEGTRLTTGRVSDDTWAEAQKHFTDEELGALVVAIATINAWNRFGVILQSVPGSLRKSA